MTDTFRERAARWVPALNAVGAIAEDLFDRATCVTGKAGDRRQVSARLFRRLFNNANAFNVLISAGYNLEAQMVLRHAIEAAICLANLETRPAEFMAELRSDVASTIIGQGPIWHETEEERLRQRQAVWDQFGVMNAAGKKHSKFDWGLLAKSGGFPHLYVAYRNLSGTSAHVTGLSVMADLTNTGQEDVEAKSREIEGRQHESAMGMMTDTMRCGCISFAAIVGDQSFTARLDEVAAMLNEISTQNRDEPVAASVPPPPPSAPATPPSPTSC